MNGLITRSGLFDDFFKDVAPGFYVKPLHGDPLPAQIKVDQNRPAARPPRKAEGKACRRKGLAAPMRGRCDPDPAPSALGHCLRNSGAQNVKGGARRVFIRIRKQTVSCQNIPIQRHRIE